MHINFVAAMEKIQIENAIEFNKLHGKDYDQLQARLDEIQSKPLN
jgi:hypothetical protein